MFIRGTGSFGNAVFNRFLKTDIGKIRVFSCYEKKQDDIVVINDGSTDESELSRIIIRNMIKSYYIPYVNQGETDKHVRHSWSAVA